MAFDQVLHDEAQEAVLAAVRELSRDPQLEAVVVEGRVLDGSTPYTFRFAPLYRSVADRAGFGISLAVRQHRQGYEHSVLLTRPASAPMLAVKGAADTQTSSRGLSEAGSRLKARQTCLA